MAIPLALLPQHSTYRTGFAQWSKIRDALAGSDVVKSKTTKYLPALDDQFPEEYREYLDRAVFLNVAERTLTSLLGTMFRKPPEVSKLSDKVPLNSVTKDGQSLLTFLRTVSEEVLSMNRYGVLLDKPSSKFPGPSFFVGYKAEDIFNWRRRVINSKLVLDQVILREVYDEPLINGYGSQTVEVYRVLALDEEGNYYQEEFPVVDRNLGQSTIIYPRINGKYLKEIPFRIVSSNRSTVDIQKPLLKELVDLNFSHYISYADLEHACKYCCLPTYYLSGAQEDKKYTVSPKRLWAIDKDDKVGILEFHGRGLDYAENQLSRKENQMSSIGGKLLNSQRKQAAESAEVAVMRERGEQAILLGICNTLDEVSSELLRLKAEWDGYPSPEATVTFLKDFSEGALTAREIRVLQQVVEANIPTPLVYKIFQSADAVPSDMTRTDFENLLTDFYVEHRKRQIEDIQLRKQGRENVGSSSGDGQGS